MYILATNLVTDYDKWQTRPLVRKGAQNWQDCNFQNITNSTAPHPEEPSCLFQGHSTVSPGIRRGTVRANFLRSASRSLTALYRTTHYRRGYARKWKWFLKCAEQVLKCAEQDLSDSIVTRLAWRHTTLWQYIVIRLTWRHPTKYSPQHPVLKHPQSMFLP
jgi:hypothetical protein